MKPAWDKLMEEFKDSKTALVADVDCTVHQDLCGKHGVQGYPTIKYGDPNNLEDYQGGRSFDDLQKFAKENLGPSCGPANLDLCDADQKAKVEEALAMSDADLDAKISEGEKKMEEAAEQKKKELEEKENKDSKKSTGNDDMKDGEEDSKSRRMTRSRSKNNNPDSAKKNKACERALFNEEFEEMSLKLQQQLYRLCEKMQLSMDNSRVC